MENRLAQAARLGIEPDPHSLAAQKQKVRGGQLVEFFTTGDAKKALWEAQRKHKPMERVLNLAFKAGKAADDFKNLAESIGADARDVPAGYESALQKAVDLNLRFNSGSAGEDAVRGMTLFVMHFTSSDWEPLGYSDEEKFDAAEGYLPALAEVWMRFALNCQTSQCRTLCNSQNDDDEAVAKGSADILQQHRTCPDCVGDFGLIWSRRLANQPTRRAAKRRLKELIGATSLTSRRCEAKHLLGQETRLRKRRGRGKSVLEIQALTFRKEVRERYRRQRSHVELSVLGSKTALKKLLNCIRGTRNRSIKSFPERGNCSESQIGAIPRR